MIELDPRANRVLSGLDVLEQEIAACHLDVVQHPGCGIHPALVAHEADGPIAVDGDPVGEGESGVEWLAHGMSPGNALAEPEWCE